MNIFLTSSVAMLCGAFGKGFGYSVTRRYDREGQSFYVSKRGNNPPPDGHWKFIVSCAYMAGHNLHIAEITVSGYELAAALEEAGLRTKMCAPIALMEYYTADRIVYMKETFNL